MPRILHRAELWVNGNRKNEIEIGFAAKKRRYRLLRRAEYTPPLAEFEHLSRQGRLLKDALAPVLLAPDSGVDQRDGCDRCDQPAQRPDPPWPPHKVDRHLKREKNSHEEEAGAEHADLHTRGRVDLPAYELLWPILTGLTGNAVTRYDTLRVELNPAPRERDHRAENNEYPIQTNHPYQSVPQVRTRNWAEWLTSSLCG